MIQFYDKIPVTNGKLKSKIITSHNATKMYGHPFIRLFPETGHKGLTYLFPFKVSSKTDLRILRRIQKCVSLKRHTPDEMPDERWKKRYGNHTHRRR